MYSINKESNRKLSATGGENWEAGLGAGFPPSAVHEDCVWRIVQEDGGGFRIITKYSQRSLYAAPDGNWESKCDAGSPGDAVHSDGVWYIDKEMDGFRITNKYSERVFYTAERKNWKRKAGAGWLPADVHADGVWYIRPAQEQTCADSEQTFADLREDKHAESPEDQCEAARTVACFKSAFFTFNGYDEESWPSGFEDIDLRDAAGGVQRAAGNG